MHMMKKWCCSNPGLGLLIVRVVVGVVFITHGLGKLSAMEGTIGFFASLGLGSFWAYAVASTELVAGFAVLVGVWTTWAATLLALVMVGALVFVKGKMGFQASELEIVLLGASLALVFSGPGRLVLGTKGHACCGSSHDEDSCACCDAGTCTDGTCTTCDCHK